MTPDTRGSVSVDPVAIRTAHDHDYVLRDQLECPIDRQGSRFDEAVRPDPDHLPADAETPRQRRRERGVNGEDARQLRKWEGVDAPAEDLRDDRFACERLESLYRLIEVHVERL